MTKKRKKIGLSVICLIAVMLILWGTDFHTHSLTMIPGSANGVELKGTLTVSADLLNTGELLDLQLDPGEDPANFIGRATIHKKTAPYTYDGVEKYRIVVGDEEYLSDAASCSFVKAGIYQVKGYITYRWKTTTAKVNAGFPRYAYALLRLEKNIVVTDLSQSDEQKGEADPQKPPFGGEEEKESPVSVSLKGKVEHTVQWEKNRKNFNAYCEEQKEKQWLRPENVFWPGEAFVLSAEVTGKQMPKSIAVSIEGTPFSTRLYRKGSIYQGSLFHENMTALWCDVGAKTLTFLFSASIDGQKYLDKQQVVVDGRRPYWIMHRKE